MDVYGCNGGYDHAEAQKQDKNDAKWLNMGCFWMHAQRQKMQHIGIDDYGV